MESIFNFSKKIVIITKKLHFIKSILPKNLNIYILFISSLSSYVCFPSLFFFHSFIYFFFTVFIMSFTFF